MPTWFTDLHTKDKVELIAIFIGIFIGIAGGAGGIFKYFVDQQVRVYENAIEQNKQNIKELQDSIKNKKFVDTGSNEMLQEHEEKIKLITSKIIKMLDENQ